MTAPEMPPSTKYPVHVSRNDGNKWCNISLVAVSSDGKSHISSFLNDLPSSTLDFSRDLLLQLLPRPHSRLTAADSAAESLPPSPSVAPAIQT